MTKEAQSLQALLFLQGKPITQSKAAELLQIDKEKIKDIVEELKKDLQENSGLSLVVFNDKIQLVTKKELSNVLQRILKEEIHSEQLTPAALETLTLIAYAGPLEKSKIDYLRGVNSDYILRNLLIRGLVEREVSEKKNTYIYAISSAFLKHLGLESVNSLPEYQHFQQILIDFLKNED